MISIAKGDPVNGRITGYYAQPRNPVEKVEIRGLPVSGPLRGTAGQIPIIQTSGNPAAAWHHSKTDIPQKG